MMRHELKAVDNGVIYNDEINVRDFEVTYVLSHHKWINRWVRSTWNKRGEMMETEREKMVKAIAKKIIEGKIDEAVSMTQQEINRDLHYQYFKKIEDREVE